MAIKITPRSDQFLQLAILRDLDTEILEQIISTISSPEISLISPDELRNCLSHVLPKKTLEVVAISKLLIALYTLSRQRHLTPDELLQGLLVGIQSSEANWTTEQLSRWENAQPILNKLLSIENIKTIVKALDLSYDYANLFQNAKVLTDIRPIFDNDASEIKGATISFTLRLYYDNLEGSKNISIALDAKDVTALMETCSRAIKKAESAKRFMTNAEVKNTFICGENNDTQ